jgi:hypothetical protein
LCRPFCFRGPAHRTVKESWGADGARELLGRVGDLLKTLALKTWALAAVGLFALGAVAPAGAADLPLYSKAPVAPVLAYEWTGVYGGLDHLFLGHHGGDLASGILVPPGRTERIGQDVDIGLIRVNYRWGGPVVAKY